MNQCDHTAGSFTIPEWDCNRGIIDYWVESEGNTGFDRWSQFTCDLLLSRITEPRILRILYYAAQIDCGFLLCTRRILRNRTVTIPIKRQKIFVYVTECSFTVPLFDHLVNCRSMAWCDRGVEKVMTTRVCNTERGHASRKLWLHFPIPFLLMILLFRIYLRRDIGVSNEHIIGRCSNEIIKSMEMNLVYLITACCLM